MDFSSAIPETHVEALRNCSVCFPRSEYENGSRSIPTSARRTFMRPTSRVSLPSYFLSCGNGPVSNSKRPYLVTLTS